jgi:two-component system chemotaxis sensor kinase CheA
MNEQLQDTFLAEAQELIVDLERGLLLLETDLQNKEGIAAIFRSMHTLKGAAGMFGFNLVMDITHHLENIYQDIRDEKEVMNLPILRITFQTLDHLRILLQRDVNHTSELMEVHESLQNDIKELVQATESSSSQHVVVEKKKSENTYYVNFLPKSNILKNGTNPLYLVDDLLVLGTGICIPFFSEALNLDSMEADRSYMGFEIILSTEKTEADIQAVFIFVEEHCEVAVKKMGDGNLLKNADTSNVIWNLRTGISPIGFSVIQSSLTKSNFKKNGATEESGKSISQKTSHVRVSADQLDDLMNLVSELVTTQAQLALFSNQNASMGLGGISENIEKITRRLRDNAFTMSLIPLDSIVVRFQRLVSDLSKELNKEIVFKAEGMDTKIDKSIIEKLTDPLLHILRNSIDHGIEKPEQRILKGKPSQGTVLMKSYTSGSNVMIEVKDDGAGIDLNRVREKAISKGLVDAHASLTDQELIELIFLPGFSTAEKITGVSGRGVGMDVVRRNLSDIRGEISVQTQPNGGTTFIIKLPLTLSILDGLLVKIGNTDFILPLSSVVKCYEVETKELERTFNQWITLEGKRTPFLFLRKEFNIAEEAPSLSQIINVPYNNSFVGLAVDKIEGEYQAVLKPLGQYYQEQDEFSGATILGNGSVALMIDPLKLIQKLTTESKTQKGQA